MSFGNYNFQECCSTWFIYICSVLRASRPYSRAKLSGEYSSSKRDWKALLPDGKFIEAQFDSKNPYPITLASHVIDDELYTWSRAPNSWSLSIDEDPRVVVRIDGALYRTWLRKLMMIFCWG